MFPPYLIYMLQPLNVVYFKPYSSNYSAKLTNYLFKTQGLLATQKGDFFLLFQGASEPTFITKLILKVFKATSIAPIKTYIIYKRFYKQDDNKSKVRPLALLSKDQRQIDYLITYLTALLVTKLGQSLLLSAY